MSAEVVADRHGISFVVTKRDENGIATEWRATCQCGARWTGPTYEATEDEWRKHVHGIRGRAPKPVGSQNERWMP